MRARQFLPSTNRDDWLVCPLAANSQPMCVDIAAVWANANLLKTNQKTIGTTGISQEGYMNSIIDCYAISWSGIYGILVDRGV